MKLRIAPFAIIGTFLYSCSPKVAPTPTEPPKPPLTPELAEGKNLYENNCAKCHRLYDRREFSPEEWKPITIRMQKQAQISDVERDKIYNYLTMK